MPLVTRKSLLSLGIFAAAAVVPAAAFVLAGGRAQMPAREHRHDNREHAAEAVTSPADAEAAVAVVERFGSALAKGDLATVESLLDPDVLILESGGAEQNRAEYMSHHAGADAKFLRGAQVQTGRRRVRVEGDTAWTGSESEIHAREDGKSINLKSTETMVLRRHDGVWRITHIHWSSRPSS